MGTSAKFFVLGAAGLALGCGTASAQSGGTGPDVIVGDLTGTFNDGGEGPQYYGSIGGIGAYSIGTTSCNIGTQELNWISSTNDHPVIGQSLYRIHDGKIQMLGTSWLKHGFFALQQSLCLPCNSSSSGGSRLGVGCSDPYSSGLNGGQNRLGPRSEVNASTGVYLYPYQNTGTSGSSGNNIYKRIQVENAEMSPSAYPGAIYVGEAQYVAKDDTASGNGLNNLSYRMARISSQASDGGYRLQFTASTERTKPAIMAWADHGLGLNQADPDVNLTAVDVPGDGRMWVGSKTIDNGDGTYTYYYAIENITSDRSGGSFSVALPSGVSVSDIGFHDITYHSGEPYNGTDWAVSVEDGAITWEVAESFSTNANANAIRWGTMYNFWFTADAPGEMVDAELGMFKPGSPASMSVSVDGPGSVACSAADIVADGVLNIDDVLAFVDLFATQDPGADFAAPTGTFNIDDVLAFVDVFAAGCP